ncbi:MAG: lipopolysaccharide heptosyltransferase I [Gammaproteobacteria bacterium]
MKVLIVKTSSLGDVLHTLPALTDALHTVPGIRFDWLVEEAFAEIPAWHPAVDTAIPVALRRWRKRPWEAISRGEWLRFRRDLRERHYDKIIDAQGLIKSALLTCMARGPRYGLDRNSAREPWSALAYQHRYPVPQQQHAIERVRQLFAAALDYSMPHGGLDYGITRQQFLQHTSTGNDIVLLHGTSWPSKQWPRPYWMRLAQLANAAGLGVSLPWGNAAERDDAQAIAETCENARVLPKLNLTELASVLTSARAVIGVDTGLAHLAAALSVPTLTLYGATRPELTGTRGKFQAHLSAEFICSPCLARHCVYQELSEFKPACYQTMGPEKVWNAVTELMGLRTKAML